MHDCAPSTAGRHSQQGSDRGMASETSLTVSALRAPGELLGFGSHFVEMASWLLMARPRRHATLVIVSCSVCVVSGPCQERGEAFQQANSRSNGFATTSSGACRLVDERVSENMADRPLGALAVVGQAKEHATPASRQGTARLAPDRAASSPGGSSPGRGASTHDH